MSNPNGLKKIGISHNPEERKRQLELTSGLPITIIKCWITLDATAHTVEQYLHRMYSRKREQGEWFRGITTSDIDYCGYDLIECQHNGKPVRVVR